MPAALPGSLRAAAPSYRAAAGLLLLAACLGCAGGSDRPVPVQARVVDLEVRDLSAIATVERVVALASGPSALLGAVDRIEVDAETGDLLVGDFRSSEQVLRFTSGGELVASYHDPGVREAPLLTLSTFAGLPGGGLALVAGDTVLLFDRRGGSGRRIGLPFAADAATAVGDRLLLRGHTTEEPLERAVWVYDLEAEPPRPVERFHPYDRRRDRLAFQQRHNLTVAGGRVYVPHMFDLALSVYTAAGEPLAEHRFSAAAEPSELWELERHELGEEERRALIGSVHRFRTALAFDGGVALVESDMPRGRVTFDLFDPDAGVLYRYPDLVPVARRADPDRLTVDGLVGSYPGGLLAIIDDPVKVAQLGRRNPRYADLEYQPSQNPLVVFLRLEMPQPRTAGEEGAA